MTTEIISLGSFISDNNVTMVVKSIAKRKNNVTDFGEGARHFLCTLMSNEGSMKVEFSQGSAHKVIPTVADVLDCLASDASGIENAKSFEDWASEYGYDTDSRKAEKIYDTCRAQAVELRDMLGSDAYETLLWNTERQ